MMRVAANLTFLWPELNDPFDRFRAAAGAGFRSVERLFVHDLDVDDVRACLDHSGLELVLFDPYAGDWDSGERGLLCDPQRRPEFVRSIVDALDIAERLGVRFLNVLAGNRPPQLSVETAIDVVRERLAEFAPVAADRGVTFLVEAINNRDMPKYLIGDVRVAVALVHELDHPAVGLLFDAYHVAMMGLDPTVEFEVALPVVRHVQVADMPGRGEPGSGGVDYTRFFETLSARGYAGRIGLEFHPTNATTVTLDELQLRFPLLGR